MPLCEELEVVTFQMMLMCTHLREPKDLITLLNRNVISPTSTKTHTSTLIMLKMRLYQSGKCM